MTHFCKVCRTPIPVKRVELGYKDTCVNHSTTSRFSGHVVADHKSTTWINIIRDPETAKQVAKLNETRGK